MATQTLPLDQVAVDTSCFEQIDGQLMERPLPNDIHSRTQLAVTVLLGRQLRGKGLAALQEWTLDEDNRPKHNWMTPDVLVASPVNRPSNGHCLPPAVLAVEVLSEGQTLEEMAAKAKRYLSWGVGLLWIIDPVAQCAAILTRHSSTLEHIPPRSGITLKADQVELTLSEIFSFEI